MGTINVTRALQEGAEAGLVGTETFSVENVGRPDQVISAGVEEQLALGSFMDHQLKGISLLSDQDVEAQFLGERYPILATVAGPPGTITHTGDLEQEIFPDDLVRLEGTVADDGVFMVATVVLAAGDTTITLRNGQALPAGGGGALGTVARVCSKQIFPYSYHDGMAGYTVTAVTGAITVTGNISDKFAAGDWLVIGSSVGNDGFWEINTVTYDAPTNTTTLIVNGGVLPNDTDDGVFAKCRDAIRLMANIPFMWTIESGSPNPFAASHWEPAMQPLFNIYRGRVAYAMVNNTSAENAQFHGRIAADAIVF